MKILVCFKMKLNRCRNYPILVRYCPRVAEYRLAAFQLILLKYILKATLVGKNTFCGYQAISLRGNNIMGFRISPLGN